MHLMSYGKMTDYRYRIEEQVCCILLMSSVEDKAVKKGSMRVSGSLQRDTMAEDGGDKDKGSLRKKLIHQIKRVAGHSKSDLKSSNELESSRKEQISLKQASTVYQEILLTKSCQLVEQKEGGGERNKLISGADGYYVEVPKLVDGKINNAHIEIEFTENDKNEYEREFMPKGML